MARNVEIPFGTLGPVVFSMLMASFSSPLPDAPSGPGPGSTTGRAARSGLVRGERGGLGPLLALGVTLSRRGVVVVASLVVSAVTVFALSIIGIILATRSGESPLPSLPLVASSALAWGGGFLHAVAASANVLRRDRAEGIVQLFATRSAFLRDYIVSRVLGLAVLLAGVVGAGTLFVSFVALAFGARVGVVGSTAVASLGALAYAIAFAFVIAPVAIAALGAGSRFYGYARLLLVLFVPEWILRLSVGRTPGGLAELCAIPSALAALRSALSAAAFEPLRAARALVALLAFSAIAVLFVRRNVARLERERA